MTSIITRSSEFVLLQIVQVTLLILLIGAITRLCGRDRPFLSLALWSIVLIKCVMPPLVYSPYGVFCRLDSIVPEQRQPEGTLRTSVMDSTEVGHAAPARAVAGLASTQGQDGVQGVAPVAELGRVQTAASASWPLIGFAVWSVGAIVLLIIYTVRCHHFLRLIRQDRHCAESSDAFLSVERLVQRLSRFIGLRRVPRLVLSDANVGPAVFGLLRPTVVLPAALVRQSTLKRLTPIVLHELIHLRRGDLWLALHLVVVRIVWWFHPLVWWSVRQTQWESERCCDESVVSRMRRDPARYAHSLINALEQSHRLKATSLVPSMRPADITAKRLERIMKMRHGCHKRMPLAYWILAILTAAAVLPGATGGWAQSPEKSRRSHEDLLHPRIAKEIEIRRRHSSRQVTVEVRIIQGHPQLCRPTDAPADADSSIEMGHQEVRLENRWILFHQEFANAGTLELPPVASTALDNDVRVDLSNGPSACATTGKSDPIVYQFVDDKQFQSFAAHFNNGHRNSSIIQAPKMTLFDRQTGVVSDTSDRPFVTDVTKIVGDDAVAYQPVIQVLWEGTRIQLTSEITADGHRMTCRFMFASIDDCKTFRPPSYPDAKDTRVQHPVVSTATFECTIEIPTGQTLLIGGLFPRRVEIEGEQSMFSRLLGRQPPKVASRQVSFISVTPRTITLKAAER